MQDMLDHPFARSQETREKSAVSSSSAQLATRDPLLGKYADRTYTATGCPVYAAPKAVRSSSNVTATVCPRRACSAASAAWCAPYLGSPMTASRPSTTTSTRPHCTGSMEPRGKLKGVGRKVLDEERASKWRRKLARV